MFKHLSNKLFSEITGVPPILRASRLPGLDGFRGVAIIIVIFSHFALGTQYAPGIRGDIGVEMFFVLSGFLITTLLLKEKLKNRAISLKQFYIRRFFRIIPVVVLFLITLAVLNYLLKLGIGVVPFVSALFFFQNIPVPGLNTYNWYVAHFWSLSVEEQFYLTFPFLLAYSVNKYTKTIIFFIIAVAAISFLGYDNVGIFYTNIVVHKIAFVIINLWGKTVGILIGSLFSILLFKEIIVVKDNLFTRYLSMVVFIVGVLIHTDNFAYHINLCSVLLFPLLMGIVIVLNLNTASFLTIIFEWGPLKYIGLISYSLYIWQQLFTNQANWLFAYNSVIVHLLIVFVAGAASYHFYERPLIKLRSKFKAVKTN